MGERIFNDTGDPRYDELPDGFESAVVAKEDEGKENTFRMEETKIPFAEIQALGERMGVRVVDNAGVTLVTFPAPYSHALRVTWCTNVRKLAIHHNLDWPHLRYV